MKIGQRLDLETEWFKVEPVSAVPAVAREKVEVIATDAESMKAGRPQADQRAVDVGLHAHSFNRARSTPQISQQCFAISGLR